MSGIIGHVGLLMGGGTVATPPELPTIPDENAIFTDNGGSTTGWTASNATLSTSSGYTRQTKGPTGGSSSSMTKSLGGFVSTDQDFILYGKARCSTGASHIGVIWLLNGSKEISIWFGTASANGTYTGGSISICGTTGASTRNVVGVASGQAYNTTPVEFALQFDKKFGQLNCFFKLSGFWELMGRVACDWFAPSPGNIQVLNTSGSPNGAWVEFEHLMLSYPNLISIGDSVCAGAPLFNPNRTSGLTDSDSQWQYYLTAYNALRNNIIVNLGVGSQSSTTIDGRIAEATSHNARVIFLHASTNDEALGVSLSTRTTNIQNSVNSIVGSGAACVLLNAMYGTSGVADNTPTPDLRDYMLDWWDNYQPGITGCDIKLDIMQPLLSGGFMGAGFTSDGLHPNPGAYEDIANYIDSFV